MNANKGEFSKAVSIRDVAARSGVSISTVSNVQNHPGQVSDATRERVEDAIRDLGYVPNPMAKLLGARSKRRPGRDGEQTPAELTQ